MIKKNTKVVFEDGKSAMSKDMVGGIPLSKGEVIKVHEGKSISEYEVIDKTVDCYLDTADQVIDITYVVRRK